MNTNQRSAFIKFLPVITTAVFITLVCDFTVAQAQQTNASPTAAPMTITLQDALARAQKNEPQYRNALTQYGVARANTVQGRAALLPNVSYAGSFLYTEGNGTASGRFITNNGVHEYISQGNAHETVSWQAVAEYRRARGAGRLAQAPTQVATRRAAAAGAPGLHGVDGARTAVVA